MVIDFLIGLIFFSAMILLISIKRKVFIPGQLIFGSAYDLKGVSEWRSHDYNNSDGSRTSGKGCDETGIGVVVLV